MFSRKHKFKTISIPEQLHAKVEEIIADTGFHNVSAFTTYVLRQIISEKAGEKETIQAEEKVKERLRQLGYL